MSNISILLIQFEQNLAWPLLVSELAAILGSKLRKLLSGKNNVFYYLGQFLDVFFEHNVDIDIRIQRGVVQYEVNGVPLSLDDVAHHDLAEAHLLQHHLGRLVVSLHTHQLHLQSLEKK